MINFTFLLLAFFASPNKEIRNHNKTCSGFSDMTEIQVIQESDTLNWVTSFKEFRNAVYQNDRNKVKQFINFPIMNENNEIWYLVYGSDEKLISKIPNPIKPFTEKDFDKYYEKIFESKFINTILKIKTDELYKSKYFETIEFKEDSTTYKMY